MEYQYTIYAPGSDEETILDLSLSAPLAHLQAGNTLLLNTSASAPGHHLAVRRIETYLNVADVFGGTEKQHMHVFTEAYSRPHSR